MFLNILIRIALLCLHRLFDFYRFAIFKKPAVAARKELRGHIGAIIYIFHHFLLCIVQSQHSFLSQKVPFQIIKSGKLILAHICTRSRNFWLQRKAGDSQFLLIAQSPRSVNYGAVYTEPITCIRFPITFFYMYQIS